MKYWRRITGCLLLFGLCFVLTGCGAFQAQMAKTTTRMAKLENFHVDAEAYLGTLMDIGGQLIRMEATVTGGFDAETDPMLLKTDLHLETLGVERDLRFFIQKEYDTWRFIPWDETRQVNQMSVEERSAKRDRTVQALKLLIKCGDYFADPVDDEVNGLHARRYDGVLPEEIVDEALVLLNVKENEDSSQSRPEEESSAANAAEIVQEGETAASGNETTADEKDETEKADGTSGTGDNAETGEAAEDTEAQMPKGLPVSIWINDEDMIVQVDVDLMVFLQNLIEQGLEQLLTEYDLDGLILDAQLQFVDARLTFSQFDELEPLRLPEY